ncbi:MAG: hypothetical protein U9R08_02965 [Nanoarchaeota archaeon]|nr:hypothetical protein [Nanoarchaeota archaeon]
MPKLLNRAFVLKKHELKHDGKKITVLIRRIGVEYFEYLFWFEGNYYSDYFIVRQPWYKMFSPLNDEHIKNIINISIEKAFITFKSLCQTQKN